MTEYWEDRIADLDARSAEVLPRLILEMRTSRHPVAVYHLADTVLARIVPPDHDLHILRDVGGSKDRERLLKVAEWTGETTLAEIRISMAALQKAKVDLDFPDWGELPPGPHDTDDLVVRYRLGRKCQVLLDSGHDPQAWTEAIGQITDPGYGGGQDVRQAQHLAALAAADGLDPAQAAAKVAELRAAGMNYFSMDAAFGPDALPTDLLVRHGPDLAKTCREAAGLGLDREHLFQLLREGMSPAAVIAFLDADVKDPVRILQMHTAGIHHGLLARARAENLPPLRWLEVLAPLSKLVTRGQYGNTVLPVASMYGGIYKLHEMIDGHGQPIPGRMAWDLAVNLRLPKSLLADQRRALAERNVDPGMFCLCLVRLLGVTGYGGTKYDNAAPEQMEEAAQAVEAGATKELLDRLAYTLGYVGNGGTGHALQFSLEQLCALVGLAPTESEAAYLGHTARSDTRMWIGKLMVWRAHHEAALAEYARLRTDRATGPFLAWLATAKSTTVFTNKYRLRTEAVAAIATSSGGGHRPGLMHAEVLQHALSFNVRRDRGGVPGEHEVGCARTERALMDLITQAERLFEA